MLCYHTSNYSILGELIAFAYNTKSFAIAIITLACNAKNFAIAIIFFSFFFFTAILDGLKNVV